MDDSAPRTRQEEIRQEYADMAKGYDQGSADCGWSAPATLARTLGEMGFLRPGVRVVDFAAGTGDLSKAFRNSHDGKTLHITATDLSPEMLDQARAKGVADALHEQDITRPWDMADGSVDVAAATGVWEYLKDDELDPVISHAAQALREGGVLAFSFLPASEGDGTQHAHTEERIREVCEKNGIDLKAEKKFEAYRAGNGRIFHHILAVGLKK